jgi:hypothetical protein
MGEMRMMGKSGDTKIIWDPENEFETDNAERNFDEHIAEGYKAFKVDKKGDKASEIKKFDPKAGKIIMSPVLAGG